MNYRTGISGVDRTLSRQFFFELLEPSERTTDPEPKVTKDGLRAIFAMLERVGLVEKVPNERGKGVIFRCILADTDKSVQKQDAPKTHQRRTHQDAPAKPTEYGRFDEQDAPKTHQRRTHQDAPPPVSGNPVLEETAIAVSESKSARAPASKPKATTARGTRLTLSELPDDWRQWATGKRPDLDVQDVWERFHDYWVAKTGADANKADWQATWRNWVRREQGRLPEDRRGYTGQRQPPMSREQAAEAANEDLRRRRGLARAGNVIAGEFSRDD